MKQAKLLLIALIALWPPLSLAHDHLKGAIEVVHPWARPTPIASVPAAAYFVIKNLGKENDRLLSAELAENYAKSVEIHETAMRDGMMRMRRIDQALSIAAGGEVVFEPGGKHVMIMGLQAPLRAGEQFPLVLTFEKAGRVKVKVQIQTEPVNIRLKEY